MALGHSLGTDFQMGTGLVYQPKLADRFQARTGYRFKDDRLLQQALTHSSHADGTSKDNERLEFLGDRVLSLVIAQALYERFPHADEGDMALRLNAAVRKQACASVAQELGLDDMMRGLAGNRAANRHVFSSKNVLGDACEAVLAAIYLDGGQEVARKFILEHWAEMLEQGGKARKDPKSALQEWALGRGLPTPVYEEVSRQGPDHAPSFVMSVAIKGNGKETGTATSKRAAEQQAAESFLNNRNIEF